MLPDSPSPLARKVILRLVVHALVLTGLLVSFSVVHAQDSSEGVSSIPPAEPSASESAPPQSDSGTTTLHTTDILFNREIPDESRREELLTLYQQQTEDYNEKERLFRISRAQWESLATLASMEEAIARTREVLVARDKVSITYAELLLDAFARSTGIEITQKDQSVADLTAHVEWLRAHQQHSEEATTREQVNARADEYTDYVSSYQTDVQRALGLLAVGKIQAIVDKADVLFADIQRYYQDNPGSVTEQVARNREYEQVKQHRIALTQELITIRQPLEDRSERSRGVSATAVIQALDTAYTATSQYLSYLYELTT